MPAGRKPPAPPVGLFLSKGPSMLQSCGTSSLRHATSSKSGCSAPVGSPLRKSQSESKEETMRAGASAVGDPGALAMLKLAHKEVRIITAMKLRFFSILFVQGDCRSNDHKVFLC